MACAAVLTAWGLAAACSTSDGTSGESANDLPASQVVGLATHSVEVAAAEPDSAATEPAKPPHGIPTDSGSGAVGYATGIPHPATAAGSPPESVDAAAPLRLDDLQPLEFEHAGRAIRLSGEETHVTRSRWGVNSFALGVAAAFGDLDGDGDIDAVAHVTAMLETSGLNHLVVGVFNQEGAAAAGPAVTLPDVAGVGALSIGDGAVEVTALACAAGADCAVFEQTKTLEVNLVDSPARVEVVRIQPIEGRADIRTVRPPVLVELGAGADRRFLPGAIGTLHEHAFTVDTQAGQSIEAVLNAPEGVWLEMSVNGQPEFYAEQRLQQLSTTLDDAGEATVSVVSFRGKPVDYELELQTLLPGLGPGSVMIRTRPSAQAGDVVYLTFDDGPDARFTPQILDVLARHNARATFFVVGINVQRFPHIVERMIDEGHTLANHTWNHEDLTRLTRAEFRSTVGRTQDILGPNATPCLRPTYGRRDDLTAAWASELGLELVGWSVNIDDWRLPGAEVIAERIVAGATDGAIVLLHDGGGNDRSQTVAGLDTALEHLAESAVNFEPVCHPAGG